MKTIYFARGFTRHKKGKKVQLWAVPSIQCKTADEAIDKALMMFQGQTFVGVVAVAHEYDESTEQTGNFKLLVQYGDL